MSSAAPADIRTFLVELNNLAAGRDLFGKRTVYVLGAGDDFVPAPSDLPDGDPLAAPAPDFVNVPRSIGKERVWRDTESITIGSKIDMPVWEIRSWRYSEGVGLAATLAAQLSAIPGWPTGLFAGNLSAGALQWIIDHRRLIHFVYLTVMKSLWTDSKIPHGNPNLVSMAIYSGPAQPGRHQGYLRRTNHGKLSETRIIVCDNVHDFQPVFMKHWANTVLGWVGTGDALLGNATVWHNFCAHYRWRLEELATILMPHHGSGGGYYNPKLLGHHGPLCVFSAGALSKHHHPSQYIIADVLRANADYIVVNENTRPSFDEHFSIDI
jgi:hypothetical protein